jgi:lipoprotein-anchoring transpeptidase ErfK/SrfK
MSSTATTSKAAKSTDAAEESTVADNTPTTSTPVSAYGFAKIINQLIADNADQFPGLKELPVQMFYSYKAKGLIGTESKPLTAEFAAEWFVTYAQKKVAREEAKAAKTKAELEGDEATDSE